MPAPVQGRPPCSSACCLDLFGFLTPATCVYASRERQGKDVTCVLHLDQLGVSLRSDLPKVKRRKKLNRFSWYPTGSHHLHFKCSILHRPFLVSACAPLNTSCPWGPRWDTQGTSCSSRPQSRAISPGTELWVEPCLEGASSVSAVGPISVSDRLKEGCTRRKWEYQRADP